MNDVISSIEENISDPNEISLELFDEKDVTLRSDLNDKEVILANALFIENLIIKKSFKRFGLTFDLYGKYLREFKRHKVSRNRLSRTEFVDVNKKNRFDDQLKGVANIKNLIEPR